MKWLVAFLTICYSMQILAGCPKCGKATNPSSDGEYCDHCDEYFSDQAQENAHSLEQMTTEAIATQREKLQQDGTLELVQQLAASLRNYQVSRPAQTRETRRIVWCIASIELSAMKR